MARAAVGLCLLLGVGAASCSLVFGIHDNLGPDEGADVAVPQDAPSDAPAEPDGSAPPDVRSDLGPDAPRDAAPEAPATGWCATEAGTGYSLCLDFDESDAGVGYSCSGGSCSLSTTSVSSPFSMRANGSNCGVAYIAPPLAHVSAGHLIHVDMRWRFDAYPVDAAQPHVIGIEFDVAAGTYFIFIDPTDGVPYLDEWASWAPNNSAPSATTNPQVSLVAGHWYHVVVDVDLDGRTATFALDGTPSRALDLANTIGAVSAVKLHLGVDLIMPCSGATVTTYQDNVVATSN